MRCLLVDDDPAVRQRLQDYLADNDLRVTTVASGREMLKTFDTEAIDLVLLDLGLVATAQAAQPRGVLVGTIPYMAPEQLTAGAIDHRADLFAVAVSLYEMLSGQLPLYRL